MCAILWHWTWFCWLPVDKRVSCCTVSLRVKTITFASVAKLNTFSSFNRYNAVHWCGNCLCMRRWFQTLQLGGMQYQILFAASDVTWLMEVFLQFHKHIFSLSRGLRCNIELDVENCTRKCCSRPFQTRGGTQWSSVTNRRGGQKRHWVTVERQNENNLRWTSAKAELLVYNLLAILRLRVAIPFIWICYSWRVVCLVCSHTLPASERFTWNNYSMIMILWR